MTLARIISIVAAVIFAVMFVTISGFVAKSILIGLAIAAVIWAITGWSTSVYARGGTRDGALRVDEGGAMLDVGSGIALGVIAACIAGGFLVMFLLSQIDAVKTWIG